MVRATSPQGGQRVSRPLSPFALPRAAPAAKMGGGRSLHFLPLLCGATTRRARPGRTAPAPHYALLQRTRGILANPLPMRVSGHNLDHDGEVFAL